MFGERAELHTPDAARGDPDSMEILRVGLAGGAQHVTLKSGVWEDPAAWGLMLADLARHIANTYAAEGQDKAAALERICEGFQAEMNSPTDEPTGNVGP